VQVSYALAHRSYYDNRLQSRAIEHASAQLKRPSHHSSSPHLAIKSKGQSRIISTENLTLSSTRTTKHDSRNHASYQDCFRWQCRDTNSTSAQAAGPLHTREGPSRGDQSDRLVGYSPMVKLSVALLMLICSPGSISISHSSPLQVPPSGAILLAR
jgi:hypothetical protein